MCIAGFQAPDEGRIACGNDTFADRSARLDLAAERRNLGMVFQSFAIWPHMTVAQNVAFPLRVRRMPKRAIKARVAEVLALVELGEHAGRYPHQLSGGQQQRVALGRAIGYSPAVLLLDEPFSNLDAKLRQRARDWLRGLQHTLGLTTVFVTHDQDEALSMSDRILVMNGGRIPREGTPPEGYPPPPGRFLAAFPRQCNLLSRALLPGPAQAGPANAQEGGTCLTEPARQTAWASWYRPACSAQGSAPRPSLAASGSAPTSSPLTAARPIPAPTTSAPAWPRRPSARFAATFACCWRRLAAPAYRWSSAPAAPAGQTRA